jgi:hypothetical protein
MDTTENTLAIEPVTMSEVLASWDHERTDEELREFLAEKENSLANVEPQKNRMPFSFLRTINF